MRGFRLATLPLNRISTKLPTLERLRFTLAFLDVAQRFGDLRFLNTALKLNDAQHPILRRDSSRASATRRLLGLHYACSVVRQEEAMACLLP